MDLLKDIYNGKITFDEVARKFIILRAVEKQRPLTPEEVEFMFACIPILKMNPKEIYQ